MNQIAKYFLAICVLGGAADWAKAGFIPAVDFTGGQPGFRDGFFGQGTYTLGYSFAVGNTPILIDALGLEIVSTKTDGQTVRIYQDGTNINLASATILATSASSTSPQGNAYAYQAITPTYLAANTTYDIVYDNLPNNSSFIFATGISTNPDVIFGSARGGFSPGLFPTSDQLSDGPYFGPSFETATDVAVAVPEPSSCILAGIAACGFVVGAWKRRRNTGVL